MHRNTARLLTSLQPAAIAVIELVGPASYSVLASFWSPAMGTDTRWTVNRIRLGFWRSIGGIAKEEVVVCKTGDSSFELICHGGNQAATRILHDLHSADFQITTSLRSVNELKTIDRQDQANSNTISPLNPVHILAAASEDIRYATTEVTTAILLDQLRGALSKEVIRIQDFVDQGRLPDAFSSMEVLLKSYALGRHLIQPFRVVLTGPPNVGKSSLMNALLGYQRAIVHETAGTTRDTIQTDFCVHGWPVLLSDTAGVRLTHDVVEQQGIARTHAELADADLILLLVDGTQGWERIHADLVESVNVPVLVVLTKCDLARSHSTYQNDTASAVDALQEIVQRQGGRIQRTSAVTNEGLDDLKDAIAARLIGEPLQPKQGVLFREDQWLAVLAWKSELSIQVSMRS